jgi:ABC-2 type transport system permease protein
MWERIREIIRKEFRQTLRDPRTRVLLVGPPILQLIIFGYAVNLDVEHSRLAWVDMDRTAESRELRAAFEGSRYFEVTALPERDEEVQDLIDHGVVLAAVHILPGFGRDVRRGITSTVQILMDGTNSNTAAIVASYATQIVTGYAAQLLEEQQNLRGIFLKGIGVEILWPQMLALALFGAAIIVLSALRFHKRLD